MIDFKQARHVEIVAGGTQSFVIENEVLSADIPADLPTLGVFVINVVDITDPKQDTLARVATVADLTTLPEGRDPGIAAPGPDGVQYLSASWIATYDTLETALSAAQAFRDRVNALGTAWASFSTDFNAPEPTPAIYEFPATDTSAKTTLILAYKTAKQDRYQKQLAKSAADTTLAAAQADQTYKQALLNAIIPIASASTVNQTEMSALAGYLSALQAAGTTFATANPSGTGLSTFQAALALAATQGGFATAYVSDAGSLATAVGTYQASRQGDVSAASTAVSTALADQSAKLQAFTAAQALEASTLAAVLAICPDFDKHSIPFVDDTEP